MRFRNPLLRRLASPLPAIDPERADIMSDAYSNVVGGGLKLKGAGIKKKKKKSLQTDEAALAESSAAAAVPPPDAASRSSSSSSSSALFTSTEQRRMQTMLKRKEEQAKAGKIQTHRDRVQAFNSYLTNMTEHYDLPKVSKGN